MSPAETLGGDGDVLVHVRAGCPVIRAFLSALLSRLSAAFAPGQVPDEPLPPDALPDGREPPHRCPGYPRGRDAGERCGAAGHRAGLCCLCRAERDIGHPVASPRNQTRDPAALDAEEEAWFVGAPTEPAPRVRHLCEACRAGTVGMPCLHTCSHRGSFLGRRS